MQAGHAEPAECCELVPWPAPVGVTAARGIKDPAEEDGDEDEGDESAGQGPEHCAKHIGPERGQACSATCSLADGNAQATCMRRS